MSCEHKNIVAPPPGKHLRVCLDCCKRLLECNSCGAKLIAGPHVIDSGWASHGCIDPFGNRFDWYTCPDHS